MISIIITFYSGMNILKSNLQLLKKVTTHINTEILVVNDNPHCSISNRDLVEQSEQTVRIITMPQNMGYAAACNYGAREAVGDLLLFLDSDIFVTDRLIDKMLFALKNNLNCGAVSATILDLQHGNVVHWGLGISNGSEVIKPYRDGKLPSSVSSGNYEFKMLTSGCILIPRKIYYEINGFDESLYNGYCDLDLTYKIYKHGYICLTCSDAIVYHRGKVAGITRMYSEEDTRALFIQKWKGDLPFDGYTLLTKLYNNCVGFIPSSSYMIANFSRSLFAKEYHKALKDSLHTEISNYYEFRDKSNPPIILEDYLSWSICGKKESIIYFADNISHIKNNYHWFLHRRHSKDLIADRNGNLITIN